MQGVAFPFWNQSLDQDGTRTVSRFLWFGSALSVPISTLTSVDSRKATGHQNQNLYLNYPENPLFAMQPTLKLQLSALVASSE